MTTVHTDTDVLAKIRELVPEIAQRSGEFESARVIPCDLVERIAATGAFRMFVPRQFGGDELSLPAAMAVIEEASRADASTGWTIMVAADFAPAFARLSEQVLTDEVYAAGPDALARGGLAPKGIAVPTDGGYIVKGRWSLASGSYDCQWVLGNCLVMENGQPKFTEQGIPEMRFAIVPADQATFVDTWDAVCLRATCSSDLIIDDVFVPHKHIGEIFGPAVIDSPLFRLPIRLGLGPTHVGIVLGIAEGALDDLRTLAKTKRPALNPSMRLAEDPVFQFRLGQLDTRLAAVRALAERETKAMWDAAVAGEQISHLTQARQRAMVAHAHTECVDIVNEAFGMAGSNAMYCSSTLQRRWRDIRTVAQHVAANVEIYQLQGALLAGEDVPPSAFA